MWNKPWKFSEGFLIGIGLIVAGLLLELTVGPVIWDAFSWPVNVIVLVFFLCLILGMHMLRKQVYAFRFLSTYYAAIPCMVFAVVLTIVMGLTRQVVDGSGFNNMLTFWPFVLIYVYMAVIVGLVTVRHLFSFQFHISTLFHAGLFITMVTATLGNADMQRLKIITAVGEPEWRAMDEQHRLVELPLAIELQDFIMEVYDDGSPKRFASKIHILTQSGKNLSTTVDVNKPVEVEGWKIYQYGYDTEMGSQSNTSILELVRDPWLPAVYTGIYMMLAGAVLMFVTGMRRKEK